MTAVRPCRDAERDAILAIVNAAAEAYRGVIPADRWHDPYMARAELDAEIAAGVAFWGYEDGDALVGVMGIQPVRDVLLIRHAYVAPASQGRGVGGALLEHLVAAASRPILVGTWAAAEWAIRFYVRHGFAPVAPEQIAPLLRAYWDIPERQIDTSVVLAREPPRVASDAGLSTIDSDADIRARIHEHWEASERGDADVEHAIYAADAILDYPQSGERFRGRSRIQAQRGGHPADRHFAIRRIRGGGDLWVSECVITYDGVPTYSLSVMELSDGLVTHETQYFADPFPAAPGRAALAEPIPAGAG